MKPLFSILIILIPAISPSQNVEINWGAKYTQKGGKFLTQEVIGHTSQHYYVLNHPGKAMDIYQYDFDNKLVNVMPQEFKANKKHLENFRIVNTNSGSYLTGTSEKNKGKQKEYYVTRIDEEGNVGYDFRLATSFDYNSSATGMIQGGYNKDEQGVFVSPDSSKVVMTSVANFKELGKGSGDEKYSIAVFDQELKKLWERQITFSYPDYIHKVRSISLSNNGEVYLFCTLNTKKRKYPSPSFNLIFYKITSDNKTEFTKVTLEDAFPIEAVLYHHTDGTVYITGFYVAEAPSRKVKEKGVFMVKYDETDKEVFNNQYPFDEEMNAKLKAFEVEKYKKVRRNFFSIKQSILNLDNETIAFAGEHQYYHVPWTDDPPVFHTDEILVPSLSFDGTLRWISCIPKEQGEDFIYEDERSFIVGQKGNDIYLVFNDDKTKEEKKAIGPKFKRQVQFTDIARINDKGEVNLRKYMFNSKETEIYIKSEESIMLREGLILLSGKKDRSSRYGVLALP